MFNILSKVARLWCDWKHERPGFHMATCNYCVEKYKVGFAELMGEDLTPADIEIRDTLLKRFSS